MEDAEQKWDRKIRGRVEGLNRSTRAVFYERVTQTHDLNEPRPVPFPSCRLLFLPPSCAAHEYAARHLHLLRFQGAAHHA